MGKSLNFPNGDKPAVQPKTDKVVANSVTYPKRITIDEAKGIKVSGEVTFVDVLNLCLNAIVSNAFRVVDFTVVEESKAKPNETPTMTVEELADYMVSVRKNVIQHLYDKMNEAFSGALNAFAPDLQLHPGLTELAIMKAEDELIKDYFASLPEDTKESAIKEAEALFAQSRRALLQKIEDKRVIEAAKAAAFVPVTPEQDQALHILVDDEATEEAKARAKEYIEANPLPCMAPAIDTESVEVSPAGDSFEIVAKPKPTKEELEACGEVCSQCNLPACQKDNVTPAAKILAGLE